MINYLEKYNNLPKDLRDKISTPAMMDIIHDLEKKYSVSLAGTIMRIMVKDLLVKDLQHFFVFNIGISVTKAENLIKELKEKVFSEIANYLDYINEYNDNNQPVKDNMDDIPEINSNTDFAGIKFDHTGHENKKNQGADFYFSIEDEDEVRRQAKDFSALDKREQIAKQTEAKIASIMGQINVIFSSEDMLRRLQQILKTYLRGVRDKLDTKEALERDIAKGGVGLDEEIADDILKVIDVINQDEAKHPGRIVKPAVFTLPEDKKLNADEAELKRAFSDNSLNRDIDYDFAKLKSTTDISPDNKKKSTSQKIINISQMNTPQDTQKPYTEVNKKNKLTEEVKKLTKKKDSQKDTTNNQYSNNSDKSDDFVLDLSDVQQNKKTVTIVNKKDIVNNNNDVFAGGQIAKARNKPLPDIIQAQTNDKFVDNSLGKIKMEDIKKPRRLGGPLEELGSMTLIDFRRTAKNPQVATKKIKEMFDLLEEEGFNKRMAGIKAWRKSPINKLYLQIGQESIIEKKEIKKIIEQRQQSKKDYLSVAEFNAIMELNTKLRY